MLFVHKTTYLTCADIRQLLSPDSIHSTDIRQPFSPDSIHSTDIRQPFSPDSIHSLTFAKGQFWEKCDSPRHIRTSNSPFWRIWGEWPLLSFVAFLFTSYVSILEGGSTFIPPFPIHPYLCTYNFYSVPHRPASSIFVIFVKHVKLIRETNNYFFHWVVP